MEPTTRRELEGLLTKWTEASSKLRQGEKELLVATLDLVSQEKIRIAWGADYNDGSPCLIKANDLMLQDTQPMGNHFNDLISTYDSINYLFRQEDINKDNFCSPIVADILIRHFAPFEYSTPLPMSEDEAPTLEAYFIEPSDESLLDSWLRTNTAPPEPNYSTPTSMEGTEATPCRENTDA